MREEKAEGVIEVPLLASALWGLCSDMLTCSHTLPHSNTHTILTTILFIHLHTNTCKDIVFIDTCLSVAPKVNAGL